MRPCAQTRAPLRPRLGTDGGAQVFDFLGEPEELLKCLEEAERLGREKSMPFLGDRCATASGVALIRIDQTTEGMALLETGIAAWEGAGGGLTNPYFEPSWPKAWPSSAISTARSI